MLADNSQEAWDWLVGQSRRSAWVDDPRSSSTPRGTVIRRSAYVGLWGPLLITIFGATFAGFPFLFGAALCGGSIAWEWTNPILWGIMAFGLFGGGMFLLGIWALSIRRTIRWNPATFTLELQTRNFGFKRSAAFRGESLGVALTMTTSAGYDRAVLMLRHRDFEGEVRMTESVTTSRTELLPLFEELKDILAGPFSDETLVPVELPDGRTLQVSREPTWSPSIQETYDSVPQWVEKAPGVAQFEDVVQELTLSRNGDELEIVCVDSGLIGRGTEERWRKTSPLADIDAVQICSQSKTARGGQPNLVYEVNVVGSNFDDQRLCLMRTSDYAWGGDPLRSTEQIQELAESLGRFLDKPVCDHAGPKGGRAP